MAMTPAHTLNLCGVLSESKRIVNAHSRHFLALSLLFLLPLSCSIVIFPTACLPQTRPDVVFSAGDYTLKSPRTLIFPIVYTFVVYLLSICALATITHSTYHGFYGRPVKFLPAIKSIIFSFFPLVSTAIAAKFFIFLISLSFLMFVVVIIKLAQNLGFVIDYNSSYFFWFCAFLGVALSLIMVYFQVNWGLASVVAVTESKWGFEPLWRSSYLVNGMRSVSLSLILVFGVQIGFWVWMASNSLLDFGTIDEWRSWDFVSQTIITSGFLSILTFLLLHYTAANTVLYMYCKALHGELAIEIAEEFAREYVSLPFDDAKVPHVVTVVSA
ncbi:uncharacterized protein LOC112522735 [Cynara cardunculus var. scolymus]|uniref:Uncharacterized protein n=1 Tax=Cynara cardunculus var. scolymus TaxID=59895 RepID=A0A124SDQ8_CYNCS|nr:uncharacterized protein LOC112522735 [Cynara cardunculus var. scolymus]KVH97722.1 hypothetical protein Ccrd_000168 [Cynara cardunculus var. scolymus]